MPAPYYSQLLLLIPLAALIAGDLRTRTVRVVWLAILSALSLIVAYNMYGLWHMAINTASNIFLLLYLSIGILIYIRFKRGAWLNPLKEYIGSGDVIFLVALTPLFDLRGYLLFLISACVFSLLWLVAARIISRRKTTIPFAATMGIALSGFILIKTFL